MSIASICNQALDIIGYKRHIGSVYDGTPAARIALNAFGETRDEVLALQPWLFARERYLLAATGPPSDIGVYAFPRPESAITVLDVYSNPRVVLEPEPGRWSESYLDGERVIVAQHSAIVAVVTDRVLLPTHWTPEFTRIVIQALAQKFSRGLVGAPPKEEDKQ